MNTDKKGKELIIAGIGEMLWDIQGDKKTFGGAPANFVCHCANLGAKASMISCIGNDDLGKQALSFLKSKNVNIKTVSLSAEYETGVVNVLLDENGVPSYEIKENVAWDYIPFSEETKNSAAEVDAVCFGSLSQRSTISRNSILKYLENTSPGCLRMFDINIRQNYYSEEIILKSLKLANALKLNEDELPLVVEFLNLKGTQKELLRAIQQKFDLKLAILTSGAEGALMLTENEESFEIPPIPKEIKSTVGAGDSFTAAAVTGYMQNKPLSVINKHANAVASFVCSQTGAVPVLPEHLKTFKH